VRLFVTRLTALQTSSLNPLNEKLSGSPFVEQSPNEGLASLSGSPLVERRARMERRRAI
jgi:hypothetical protein